MFRINSDHIISVKTKKATFVGEIVKIRAVSGEQIQGEVISIEDDLITIYTSESLIGIGKDDNLQFLGEEKSVYVSSLLVGKKIHVANPNEGIQGVFLTKLPLRRRAYSPSKRVHPSEPIITGNPAIDHFTPIVKGQKIAFFQTPSYESYFLLPSFFSSLKNFLKIICLIGVDQRKVDLFNQYCEKNMAKYILIYSLETDSKQVIVDTPHYALRVAEYFSNYLSEDVVVLLDNMENFSNNLRDISLGKKEMPGRKSYPTYLFSEYASIYERAGTFSSSKGSLTLFPLIPLANEDFDSPLVDTTGYITEGQIILSKEALKTNPLFPFEVKGGLSRMGSIFFPQSYPLHEDFMNFTFQKYIEAASVQEMASLLGSEGLGENQLELLEFKKFVDSFIIGSQFPHTLSETASLVYDSVSMLNPSVLPNRIAQFLVERKANVDN